MTGGVVNEMCTNRVDVVGINSHTGVVLALSPMRQPRVMHTSVAAGHLIFVFGGSDEQHGRLSSCELFDTRSIT